MVKAIRNIEVAISGSGLKEPSLSESKNKVIARKSIVALKSIKKGEKFTEKNLGIKRPGSGINPMKWNDIIGGIATKSYSEDQQIEND